MLKNVWNEKGIPGGTIDKDVTSAIAQHLWDGVASGYGKDIVSVDFESTDWNMLAALQRNVWHFSAAKNYTQLRDLSNALLDDEGKLRSFRDFKNAAFEINDKHINQHLKTEYNLAVAGGQMSAKWVDIEDTKHIFPYLEFDAVIDKQTSDKCRQLNGTLLPVDHPFWDIYYPPNHFNCRSTVRKRSSGVPTANIPGADIPDMFKTNLGKQGLIFPEGHSYFFDLPKDLLSEALKTLPGDIGFVTINKFENGGVVRVHRSVDVHASDYEDILEAANYFATGGHFTDIMPNVLNKESELYKSLFNDAKGLHCPDIRIDRSTFIEVKRSTNSKNPNNVKHQVDSGSKQADIVYVKCSEDLGNTFLNRLSKSRFQDHKDLQTIYFQTGGRIEKFERDMFFK